MKRGDTRSAKLVTVMTKNTSVSHIETYLKFAICICLSYHLISAPSPIQPSQQQPKQPKEEKADDRVIKVAAPPVGCLHPSWVVVPNEHISVPSLVCWYGSSFAFVCLRRFVAFHFYFCERGYLSISSLSFNLRHQYT